MSIKKERKRYAAGMMEVVGKLEILNKDYSLKHNYNLMEHITYRLKSKESIKQKLHNDGFTYCEKNLSKINDIAGVRVVVAFEKDIAIVRSLILSIPNIEVIKEKDYVNNPKKSGYESYHMIVKVPVAFVDGIDFVVVEIQIRTLIMDAFAAVHHKLVYKKENTNLEDEFVKYSNILMNLDEKFNEYTK